MTDPRRLVVALAAVVALAGCGGGPSAGDGGPPDPDSRYYDVLGDDDATADEVIAVAGAPTDIGRTSDGTVLLTYRISDQEGGEAEKGAWLLVGPDGGPVASALTSSYTEVTSFDDGLFLTGGSGGTLYSWVDEAGEERKLPKAVPSVPTRAGDTLVADVSQQAFYRPGDATVHRMPAVPGESPDSYPLLALDPSDGTVWAVPSTDPRTVPLERSADGRSSWSTQDVPRPADDDAPPYAMTAGHGRLAMTFVELMAEGGDRVADLVVSDGATVRSLIGTGLPVERFRDPTLSFLPDGRLVAGDGGGDADASGWWVATSAANTSFARLDTPEAFTTVRAAGDALVAIGSRPWVSTDQGATWDRVGGS